MASKIVSPTELQSALAQLGKSFAPPAEVTTSDVGHGWQSDARPGDLACCLTARPRRRTEPRGAHADLSQTAPLLPSATTPFMDGVHWPHHADMDPLPTYPAPWPSQPNSAPPCPPSVDPLAPAPAPPILPEDLMDMPGLPGFGPQPDVDRACQTDPQHAPTVRRTVSQSRFLVPNLRAALKNAGAEDTDRIRPSTPLCDVARAVPSTWLVAAIRDWPAFDDIAPQSEDFDWVDVFTDVLTQLERAYEAVGIDVIL